MTKVNPTFFLCWSPTHIVLKLLIMGVVFEFLGVWAKKGSIL